MEQFAAVVTLATGGLAYHSTLFIDEGEEFLVIVFHIYNLTIYDLHLRDKQRAIAVAQEAEVVAEGIVVNLTPITLDKSRHEQ